MLISKEPDGQLETPIAKEPVKPREEIIACDAYSNTFDRGDEPVGGRRRRARKTIVGGVPNVPDGAGNFRPLDNTPKVVADDPRIGIVIPRAGLGQIGFHDKRTNTYESIIRLNTGESIVRSIKGCPEGSPTINKAKRYVQWDANGGWVREYVTERRCKQVVKQRAGLPFTEVYRLSGLTPRKSANKIDFLRKGAVAFSVQRPYYISPDKEWLGWVPLTWQKVGDNYELTYPEPAEEYVYNGYAYIDPTIEFGATGEGVGTPKDSTIRGHNDDRSDAGLDTLYVSDIDNYTALLRFDLSSIPSDATIDSAVLTLTSQGTGQAPDNTLSFHKLTTNWGVTDTAEGDTEDPATGGQATFRRAFDYNGAGGDVTWASGVFSAADYDAAEASLVVGSLSGGETVTPAIPSMVGDWVSNPASNYGLAVIGNTVARKDFASKEEATATTRPFLTVEYTEIPSSGAARSLPMRSLPMRGLGF